MEPTDILREPRDGEREVAEEQTSLEAMREASAARDERESDGSFSGEAYMRAVDREMTRQRLAGPRRRVTADDLDLLTRVR